MDVMVHNTLVKLCTDHFESNDIEAGRQLLYSYDTITKLNLKKIRLRQGPAKDKTNIVRMITSNNSGESEPTSLVVKNASEFFNL